MPVETMELAVINPANAVEIFTGGGLSKLLADIEAQVRSVPLDISTAPGRDQVRSLAYKVARTKTALDAEAKKLTEGWRESTKKVNEERKRATEFLETLADEVRAPLTAFENRDKLRVAAHEWALAELSNFSSVQSQATADELVAKVAEFAGLHSDRQWEEFGPRANRMRAEIAAYLNERLVTRRQFDADQAELARLRKEEAARLVREREERLKAEAAEAARIDAERRAKESADAEARRVIAAANAEQARVRAEAERVRAEHERAQKEAEAKAKAIDQKRQAEETARKAAEKRAADAEADRLAAEAKAAEVLKAAQEKAKRDTEAALARQRDKAERERKAAEDARLKREADEALRERIAAEIGEDITRMIGRELIGRLGSQAFLDLVGAIMDGKLRHVKVVF
jgi:hypothetical protein